MEVQMASSSDSEDEIAISCRRRATRARRSFLEDVPSVPTEQLFHDREVYAAEGESGDESECSLNKLKSSFAVAEGKCDQNRRTSKVSKKKELRKMRSETQRILRATSVNMPAYQPKKKTLDGFLAKLQHHKPRGSKGPCVSSSMGEGTEQPRPLRQLEPPQQVKLSSEVEQFRDKFAQHFLVQGSKGRGSGEGASTGMGLEHLKSRLWEDLVQRRAVEIKRLEEVRRFEEDEGLDLGEEGDAEFTDSSMDDSEMEDGPDNEETGSFATEGSGGGVTEGSRGGVTEGSGGGVTEGSGGGVTEGSGGGVTEGSGGGVTEESGGGVTEGSGGGVTEGSGGGVTEGSGGGVTEESGGGVTEGSGGGVTEGSGGGGCQLVGGEEPSNIGTGDGSSFAAESDSDGDSRCGSDTGHSLPQLKKRRRGVLDSEDESEGVSQLDGGSGSHRASSSQEGSPKSTLTASEFSQDLFSDATSLAQPAAVHITSDLSLMEGTQFLDTQGFLCIREPQRGPPSALPDLLGKDMGQPMDILDLCSGRFGPSQSPQGVTEGPGPSTQAMCELLGIQGAGHVRSPSPPKLLLSQQQETVEADKSLLELCSGRFATPPNSAPHLVAPPPVDTSDNAVDGAWSDEDMPVLRWKHTQTTHLPTKRERLEEFVESEAELSGSDVSSDEEDNRAGSGLDQYEEEGRGSDVPHSDTELHQQVNKIHMKQLLADDKADLREIKERFLADGDLVEDGMFLKDGLFRKRKLAHMGSEGSLDLFADERTLDSGGEDVDEDSDDLLELNRRRTRVEKEQYLRFMRSRQSSLLDADEESQSMLSYISVVTPPVPRPTVGVAQPQCGSFLKRSHSQLKRMALGTSAAPSVQGKKGFVFQVSKEASQDTNSCSLQDHEPERKRLKIDQGPPLPEENSVFHILQ